MLDRSTNPAFHSILTKKCLLDKELNKAYSQSRNMIPVNLTAVVVSAVAAMGVGFLWYSETVFGKRWMRLEGLDKNKPDKSGMAGKFGLMFATTLISAYILSLFIHYAGATGWILGAKTGLWAWLGFVMPAGLGNHLFSRKPFELFLVQTGHHLTGLLVIGAVLGAWR
ncbi:DUF1761 domain-containing protein [Candidatus Daviesbacteria bacterium]|nr:DUF1761 domain-containing protein [Candidatus Daviesbacteria bacterium]